MSCEYINYNTIYFQLMSSNMFGICARGICVVHKYLVDIGMNILLWLLEGIGVDVHTDIG